MTNDGPAISEMFETVSLGSPERAVGFVLWRVSNRYQREADRALVPLGLTHLQFMTLIMAAWLARAGEAVRQAEIARSGDIHPMQASLMLKTLEEKGLVVRDRSPSDVRAKVVFVTKAGLEALRMSLPRVIEVQCRLFKEAGGPNGDLLVALLEVDHTAQD